MPKSNAPSAASKSRKSHPKPHKDFPLGPHPRGYWCKKVKGKLHYFGKIKGDEKGIAALALWLEQKDELLAGRTPRPKDESGELTIRECCHRFLVHCDGKLARGEMAARTRADYEDTTDRIVRVLGRHTVVVRLTPADFARLRADISKGNGPVTVAGLITRARVVFNYAFKAKHIKMPVEFGLDFQRPSAKQMRAARNAKGQRMFEAGDCRRLIDDAHSPELKAMILLGLNAGLGNADCAKLPVAALNLDTGWLDYPRPKTEMPRRCYLWPETIAALREVLARRAPGRKLVFVTKSGGDWADAFGDTTAVTHEFRKLLVRLDLHRKGLGFYTLRHVFRTVADAALDQPAANHIMGHTDGSMASVYRERIDDARLRRVALHVRAWLFPDASPATTQQDAPQASQN